MLNTTPLLSQMLQLPEYNMPKTQTSNTPTAQGQKPAQEGNTPPKPSPLQAKPSPLQVVMNVVGPALMEAIKALARSAPLENPIQANPIMQLLTGKRPISSFIPTIDRIGVGPNPSQLNPALGNAPMPVRSFAKGGYVDQPTIGILEKGERVLPPPGTPPTLGMSTPMTQTGVTPMTAPNYMNKPTAFSLREALSPSLTQSLAQRGVSDIAAASMPMPAGGIRPGGLPWSGLPRNSNRTIEELIKSLFARQRTDTANMDLSPLFNIPSLASLANLGGGL